MTKFFNKVSLGMTLGLVGLLGYSNFASAAADTDLASATAMISTGISDNKGTLLTYGAGVVVLAIVIAGGFRLFAWGKKQILGSIGGSSRGRRNK